MSTFELAREKALTEAQEKAAILFKNINKNKLIFAGLTEQQLSQSIHELSNSLFGTTKNWHKRIVRSGSNTLSEFKDNPEDRIIEEDDIIYIDLGPVFEEWEADFGRTYVLGDDPVKHKLCQDLETVFRTSKEFYSSHKTITKSEMYQQVQKVATDLGWIFEEALAGHVIGEFPHSHLFENKSDSYITSDNHQSMRSLDQHGRILHWILEIKLIEKKRRFAGFFEDFLTIKDFCN